jgi:hypothetical protein
MKESINIKTAPPNWKSNPAYVYIGRRNATYGVAESPHHNPIVKGEKCSECGLVHRDAGSTLPCYTQILERKINSDPVYREQVKQLYGKTLVCWCAPNPCHGHILARYAVMLNEPINKENRDMIYAGIGSRETPKEVLVRMYNLAEAFALMGYRLRSGHAGGADLAFEDGCILQSGPKEIFLPWSGFNDARHNPFKDYYVIANEEAEKIASRFHPAWERLSQGAKRLMVRNVYQVLGPDLKTHSDFVVCWTNGGGPTGGTGQAIRIANEYGIEVYNLYNQKDVDDLYAVFKTYKEI